MVSSTTPMVFPEGQPKLALDRESELVEALETFRAAEVDARIQHAADRARSAEIA
jgi:hypothetical protein